MADAALTETLIDRGHTGHVLLDARPLVEACSLAGGSRNAKEFKEIQRRLWCALVFCLLFMFIEVIGGFLAGSLAILTDAAHMLADVSGFGVSLFAGAIAARQSSTEFSYGYHRVEVLGALVSTLTVWLVTGMLLFQAVMRIINPEPVNGKMMFFLAMLGVVVNLVNFFILGHHGHSHGDDGEHHHSHNHSHTTASSTVKRSSCHAAAGGKQPHDHQHQHKHSHGGAHDHDHRPPPAHQHHSEDEHEHEHCDGGGAGDRTDGEGRGDCDVEAGHGHGSGEGHEHASNLNLRGAVVHVMGDLVQSLGVVCAGALIWWKQDDPRFLVADPICTFLFAFLTLLTTRAIIRDIQDILMERAPRGLDMNALAADLRRVQGVLDIHDLHVWGLTPGIPLLAVHVLLQQDADATDVLHEITSLCRGLGIEHTTVQMVQSGRMCPCAVTPEEGGHFGQQPAM